MPKAKKKEKDRKASAKLMTHIKARLENIGWRAMSHFVKICFIMHPYDVP